MKRIIIAMAAVPTMSHAAAPAHLACTLATSEGRVAIGLTIDSTSQAVTYTVPADGYSAVRSGTFTTDSIAFDIPLRMGAAKFAIDRGDLSLVRVIGTTVDRGTCTKQRPGKKAV